METQVAKNVTIIQSGAASWTTSRRQQFANDLSNPQLIAVTDNVNQSKGDQGPESWKPPLGKQQFLSDRLGPIELRILLHQLPITARTLRCGWP